MTFDFEKLDAAFDAADAALKPFEKAVSTAQGTLNAAVSAYEEALLAQVEILHKAMPPEGADEYDEARDKLSDYIGDNVPAGMEWDGDVENPEFWEPSTC